MSTPNDFLHDICRAAGHDLTEPSYCLRCKRFTLPELKSAATKNFNIFWDEMNRKITITFNGGWTATVDRSEAATLARLLKSMSEYDD